MNTIWKQVIVIIGVFAIFTDASPAVSIPHAAQFSGLHHIQPVTKTSQSDYCGPISCCFYPESFTYNEEGKDCCYSNRGFYLSDGLCPPNVPRARLATNQRWGFPSLPSIPLPAIPSIPLPTLPTVKMCIEHCFITQIAANIACTMPGCSVQDCSIAIVGTRGFACVDNKAYEAAKHPPPAPKPAPVQPPPPPPPPPQQVACPLIYAPVCCQTASGVIDESNACFCEKGRGGVVIHAGKCS